MHRLKIHSKVKEEEKSKFREYESPLFYYMYEFFLHGFLFFLMKMSCVAQGVGAVGGESWTPKGNQRPGGYLCPEASVGRRRWARGSLTL